MERGYFLKTAEINTASGIRDFNGLAYAKGFLTIRTTGASAYVRLQGNHDPAVFPWQTISAIVPITGAATFTTAIISANYGYFRAIVVSAYSGAGGSASVDAFMSMVH